MAVTNSIKKATPKKDSQLVKFDANGYTVELSPQIVRDYLVSGSKERVSIQEIVMFINRCKFNGLNPWLGEAYCVKYGDEPATIVIGKEAFEKRAENHPQHDGHRAGIITFDPDDGNIEYRIGSFKLPGEQILGGWAEVWRKDHRESTRIEVPFDEYAGRKKDGSLNRKWASKPGTMIRKVALVQALKEAFPKTFDGMNAAEEMGVDDGIIDVTPVAPPVDPSTGELIEAPAEAAPASSDPDEDFFGN